MRLKTSPELRTRSSLRTKIIPALAGGVVLSLLIAGLVTWQKNEQLIEEEQADVSVLADAPFTNQQSIGSTQALTTETVETAEKAQNGELLASKQHEAKGEVAKSKTASSVQKKSNESTASVVKWAEAAFTVEGTRGKLSWSTLSEQNTKTYQIQRSVDGVRYKTLGQVSGSGRGSSQNKQYGFEDKELSHIEMPRVFYRVNALGLNGENIGSKLVRHDFNLDIGMYMQVEKIDQNEITLLYAGDQNDTAKLHLLDASHTVLQESELKVGVNAKLTQFAILGTAPGSYYLRIQGTKHSLIEPVVIPE